MNYKLKNEWKGKFYVVYILAQLKEKTCGLKTRIWKTAPVPFQRSQRTNKEVIELSSNFQRESQRLIARNTLSRVIPNAQAMTKRLQSRFKSTKMDKIQDTPLYYAYSIHSSSKEITNFLC